MKLKISLIAFATIFVLAAFRISNARVQSTGCNSCDTLTGLEKVVCLAEEFKSSLTASQISTLQQAHTLANAKKWSNLPVGIATRLGLRFGDLSADQLAKAKAVLEAAYSADPKEGYNEMVQLWAADQYLAENGGGNSYGAGQYFIAFLGEPSLTGSWELQAGGHHLASANSYSNGQFAGATPSFRGVEPFAAFQSGGNTYQPMIEERDSLAAMLNSLTASELATAKLSTTFNDILLGPNKDWQFPTTKLGIKCSQLTTAQKTKVLAAIRTYVNDIDETDAAAYMALYASQLDDTYIAYANNTGLSLQNDYVRIDGPRVWIEYSVQNGIILTPKHPHSVWRDHQTDYGGLGLVGASDIAKFEGKFEIYPNPASSSTAVAIELAQGATVSVTIADMAGKIQSNGFKYKVGQGSYNFPLQLSDLANGQYNCILEVEMADGAVQKASKLITKI